jgi:hypothetical protein
MCRPPVEFGSIPCLGSDARTGQTVDRLAKRTPGLQLALRDVRRIPEQPALDQPTSQILRVAQPLKRAPPPLTDRRHKIQAHPPALPMKEQLSGRQVINDRGGQLDMGITHFSREGKARRLCRDHSLLLVQPRRSCRSRPPAPLPLSPPARHLAVPSLRARSGRVIKDQAALRTRAATQPPRLNRAELLDDLPGQHRSGRSSLPANAGLERANRTQPNLRTSGAAGREPVEPIQRRCAPVNHVVGDPPDLNRKLAQPGKLGDHDRASEVHSEQLRRRPSVLERIHAHHAGCAGRPPEPSGVGQRHERRRFYHLQVPRVASIAPPSIRRRGSDTSASARRAVGLER